MALIRACLVMVFLFTGCIPYTCKTIVSLEEAGPAGGLVFSDAFLDVRFSLGRSTIEFILINRSDGTMVLNWDGLSFSWLDGVLMKAVRVSVPPKDPVASQPPSVLEPRSVIVERIVPMEYVFKAGNVRGGWEVADLFPCEDREDFPGKKFTIHMPIVTTKGLRDYRFTFAVREVQFGLGSEIPDPADQNMRSSAAERLIRESQEAFASGEWAEVIRATSNALRLDPGNALAFAVRGGAYANQGLLNEAIADCRIAMRIDPTLGLAYNNSGYAHERLGRWAEARGLYKMSCNLGLELGCSNYRRLPGQ